MKPPVGPNNQSVNAGIRISDRGARYIAAQTGATISGVPTSRNLKLALIASPGSSTGSGRQYRCNAPFSSVSTSGISKAPLADKKVRCPFISRQPVWVYTSLCAAS
ncbi:hypothetical protein ES703_74062 [subsurface metagenome]